MEDHATGFVPRIIASTSALAASIAALASAFSLAISSKAAGEPPRFASRFLATASPPCVVGFRGGQAGLDEGFYQS